MPALPADEISEKYLQKAISEINELGDEIARAAEGVGVPVVGSGHPLADIMLLKYGPQAAEAQEGVAFYGRAGQAILKSLQRLNVDPLSIYGTNCLKFADGDEDEARPFLVRELHLAPWAVGVAVHLEELAWIHLVRGAGVARMRRRVGGMERVLDVRHPPHDLSVRGGEERAATLLRKRLLGMSAHRRHRLRVDRDHRRRIMSAHPSIASRRDARASG